MGRYDDAEDAIAKAIEIKPDFIETWHNLANIYGWQERYEECENTLRNAVSIAPKNTKA